MQHEKSLIRLENASFLYGDHCIFQDVTLDIKAKQKIALMGRNGAGKSTLIAILHEDLFLNKGERLQQSHLRIAALPQVPRFPRNKTPLEILSSIPHYEVERLADLFSLKLYQSVDEMSGGELRKLSLIQTFGQPADLLLLDEPTNHLDINTIEILENLIRNSDQAILTISHDRQFLEHVCNGMVLLSHQTLHQTDWPFSRYDEWLQYIETNVNNQYRKLQHDLAEELQYKQQGVTGRRARNEKRVEKLKDIQQEIRMIKQYQTPRTPCFVPLEAEKKSPKILVRCENISLSYEDKIVIKNFSTVLTSRSRIGIIGSNGSGKTTLIKILIGQLPISEGSIIFPDSPPETAYFDQTENFSTIHLTPYEYITEKTNTPILNGTPMNVMGYLKKFNFNLQKINTPIEGLSGGERNRLRLARTFTRPCSCLILDEPTNDLDTDTLLLLENTLNNFKGTLLIISHDRNFLERTTNVIWHIDNNTVKEYIGGYREYAMIRKQQMLNPSLRTSKKEAPKTKKIKTDPPKTLSFKEQQDLETLPQKIEEAEKSIKLIEQHLTPILFQEDPIKFEKLVKKLETFKENYAIMQNRWIEIEIKKDEISQSNESDITDDKSF